MTFEHLFNELEISTDPFAVCELKGACNMGLGREATATLHYVLCGEGEISVSGRPPLAIEAGSFVLIPALQSHALHSFGGITDPIPHCNPAELKLGHLLHQADMQQTNEGRLIALCAHVSIGLRGAADMIDLVREPLVERISADSRMKPMLSSLLYEISHPGLGSQAMIRTILTQCMIELLRSRLGDQDQTLAWMAALKDPLVWNALRAMLDAPGESHSVESLAIGVGMSRSAFAKRFSDAYGSGPMDLLRDLRMRLAGSLLRESSLPVKKIAEMVGFTSRSSFSRMFENKTGQSPRKFRTNLRD